MQADTYGYFAILGTFEPDEISRQLGLVPSHTARKGDPVLPGAILTHKRDYWELDSGLTTESTPSEHISSLVSRLGDVTPLLRRLADHHELRLSVAIYLRGAQGPETWVGPAALRWLSEVGAAIDFDLYALPDDTDQDD